MTQVEQPCYTLINTAVGELDPPSEHELKKQLEAGNVQSKIEGLKQAIGMLLNGERLPTLLMTVIRFVMPSDNHTIKKLLLIFWEIVPKYGTDGKLLHEMILVCDAYRKDLEHPNEYLRGSTLRFLCKLREPELLEPLMPAIQTCLAHRHSYVRRNAVLAIYTIYKNFAHLIPDAPEVIHKFIQDETDPSCKRNAFIMLSTTNQTLALQYLSTCIDQVANFNEILQLVVVELVHKVCRSDPAQRSKFIRCIFSLLGSASAAVRCDAAGTLLTMSTAPSAVAAAAKCYIELIVSESDNNVKLIVLDRVVRLKENPSNERVLQDLAMDVLRVLAAPDLEVREKTLRLVLELVSGRNAHEVVTFLKKELAKTSQESFEKTGEYRQLLVRTLHSLGVRFPDLAPAIVPQLMEFLSDTSDDSKSAINVILFVREAFETLAEIRTDMLEKLLAGFGQIRSDRVVRAALWILGEYASTRTEIEAVMEEIKRTVGPLPIVDLELKEAAEAEAAADNAPQVPQVVTRTRITADGTYATESVYTVLQTTKKERPSLRQLFLDGEFFVAASLAACLTKLALRYASLRVPARDMNTFKGHAMLVLASIMHLGTSGLPKKAIGQDTHARVMQCVRSISIADDVTTHSFLCGCHEAFSKMLQTHKAQLEAAKGAEKGTGARKAAAQAHDLISFRALRAKEDQDMDDDDLDLNIIRATGSAEDKDKLSSKLSKVVQLSGFSDPVYVEAYVHVHQYDILLDVLVVNQTADTLQNLTLELATLGDLKLTEKPASYTVAGHDFCNIKANVKVSSTESGFIFGSIVYDLLGAASDRNCVILNDIHIDILDYITPSSCTDVQFRDMWSAFEWENKVSVRTTITELREYLSHLLRVTNMRCLTPESALAGECNYLAVNLYARSVFGEDALANLSIEKLPDGQLTGHVRIRSKTQGIAISIGDKITRSQKGDQAKQQ